MKLIGLGAVVLVVVGLAAGVGLMYHDGYRAYVVHTGSMSPTIPSGDLVIDKPARDGFHAGDVITFRHGQGADLVTHRMVAMTKQGVRTKGDGNRTADVWNIRPAQVEGVVATHLPDMGYLVVFMQHPTGIAGTVLAGISLLLLWGVFFPQDEPLRQAVDDRTPEREPKARVSTPSRRGDVRNVSRYATRPSDFSLGVPLDAACPEDLRVLHAPLDYRS
ncbi:MAG TPA: signal peptidase I [Nocardioidaceae bacterium]|nr:signal peptidase I [Nocardioidaceae bacterium]